MKISVEKRKMILLESFEVIKDNYVDNKNNISELIGKMFKVDETLAIDMWLYILKKHNSFLKSDSYSLAEGLIYQAQNNIGKEKIANIVLNNPIIKEACFSKAEFVSVCTVEIICQIIKQNELNTANELLLLIQNNNNKRCSLYDVIENAIPFGEEITEEAFDLLNSWINKIDNKEERAKLNVKMLEFMEDE